MDTRLLPTNNASTSATTAVRRAELSRLVLPGRFEAVSPTAASSVPTTTRSGRYRKVCASSSAVNADERMR